MILYMLVRHVGENASVVQWPRTSICILQVRMPHNFEPVTVRVGIHSGSCTSGLIGTKLPKFSIFGDTMNTVRVVVTAYSSEGSNHANRFKQHGMHTDIAACPVGCASGLCGP